MSSKIRNICIFYSEILFCLEKNVLWLLSHEKRCMPSGSMYLLTITRSSTHTHENETGSSASGCIIEWSALWLWGNETFPCTNMHKLPWGETFTDQITKSFINVRLCIEKAEKMICIFLRDTICVAMRELKGE